MRSSSLELVKEAGIESPQAYRDSLIHDWYVPPPFFEHLQIYYLDTLPTEELFAKIKDGVIVNGSKLEYHIVWVHKPTTVKKAKKAICSFRYCYRCARVCAMQCPAGNRYCCGCRAF